jgi:hypothetical protein
LGRGDGILGSPRFGLSASILCIEFRHFQGSQYLAGVNTVTNVDVDVSHIAGDLSVNIHDLIWLELTGEAEQLRDAPSLNQRDCCRRGRRWTFLRIVAITADENQKDSEGRGKKPEHWCNRSS